MQLPVIPSVPGAPDVAIVSLRVSIGPQGLTYYEQAEGNTLAYTPKGILLPDDVPTRRLPVRGQLLVSGRLAPGREDERALPRPAAPFASSPQVASSLTGDAGRPPLRPPHKKTSLPAPLIRSKL